MMHPNLKKKAISAAGCKRITLRKRGKKKGSPGECTGGSRHMYPPKKGRVKKHLHSEKRSAVRKKTPESDERDFATAGHPCSDRKGETPNGHLERKRNDRKDKGERSPQSARRQPRAPLQGEFRRALRGWIIFSKEAKVLSREKRGGRDIIGRNSLAED